MRAIPTTYAGVQFRSRLEATWAFNLDGWGIRWSYEPEAFALPSGANYLPDFWIPGSKMWLEIKGPGLEGLDKTEEFASSSRWSGRGTGCSSAWLRYAGETGWTRLISC